MTPDDSVQQMVDAATAAERARCIAIIEEQEKSHLRVVGDHLLGWMGACHFIKHAIDGTPNAIQRSLPSTEDTPQADKEKPAAVPDLLGALEESIVRARADRDDKEKP